MTLKNDFENSNHESIVEKKEKNGFFFFKYFEAVKFTLSNYLIMASMKILKKAPFIAFLQKRVHQKTKKTVVRPKIRKNSNTGTIIEINQNQKLSWKELKSGETSAQCQLIRQ